MANDDTDFGQATSTSHQSNNAQDAKKKASAGKATWMKVGAGAAAGIVLGSGGTAFAYAAQHGEQPTDASGEQDASASGSNANGTAAHPSWADQSISVATSVNDNMSFSEAFAAARAEVGRGGAFEWHGKIYGTYYATEWDDMSAAEKNEYASHFSWSAADTSNSTHHAASHEHSQQEKETTAHHSYTDTTPDDDRAETPIKPTPATDDHTDNDEVQVLGVVHDSDNDINVAAVVAGGQEVFLVDANNDLEFEVAMADQNHDGQIQEEEMRDISDAHITVEDMGGFTTPPPDTGSDDMLASNGGPDYVNDADGVYDL